jgi:hypothetical protein
VVARGGEEAVYARMLDKGDGGSDQGRKGMVIFPKKLPRV